MFVTKEKKLFPHIFSLSDHSTQPTHHMFHSFAFLIEKLRESSRLKSTIIIFITPFSLSTESFFHSYTCLSRLFLSINIAFAISLNLTFFSTINSDSHIIIFFFYVVRFLGFKFFNNLKENNFRFVLVSLEKIEFRQNYF